jgi:hypothetical protein
LPVIHHSFIHYTPPAARTGQKSPSAPSHKRDGDRIGSSFPIDFQRSAAGAVKEKTGNPNKLRQKRPAATLGEVKSREERFPT